MKKIRVPYSYTSASVMVGTIHQHALDILRYTSASCYAEAEAAAIRWAQKGHTEESTF